MANPSKAKGSKWAKDVCIFFAAHGFPFCERRVDGGVRDRGDVAGIPGVVVQCKNTARIDLAEALTEARKQASEADAPMYFAAIKRRNHSVAKGYAVFELDQAAALLAAWTKENGR